MAVKVDLKKGKLRKKGFVGFSWTTFFFNFFVPLFRGDYKWAGIMFVIQLFVLPFLAVSLGDDEASVGFIMILLVLAYDVAIGFIYNKFYTENLLREGFEPVGDSDKTALKFSGLYTEDEE